MGMDAEAFIQRIQNAANDRLRDHAGYMQEAPLFEDSPVFTRPALRASLIQAPSSCLLETISGEPSSVRPRQSRWEAVQGEPWSRATASNTSCSLAR